MNSDFKVAHPHSGSFFFTIPCGIGIYKCWLLRMGVPGVKLLEAKERSNNKLNPHNYGVDA